MTNVVDLKIVEKEKPPTYSVLVYPSAQIPDQFKNMILSKWMRSLKFGNPLFKMTDDVSFYKQYEAYIINLMSKPDSVTRIAALTDEPDTVLGFSTIREEVVLDYVHVHRHQRRQGIGKSLVPMKIKVITHLTKDGLAIWQKEKYKYIKFDPFL